MIMTPELRAKIKRSRAVYALGESLGFVQNSAWIPGKKTTIDDWCIYNKPKGRNIHDFCIGTYNLNELEEFYKIMTAIIATK